MVKAGLIEWWQPGGTGVAGTFIVRAYTSSRWSESAPLITPELTAAIQALVAASAPASRPFTIQVGVVASASLGIAATFHPAFKISRPEMDLTPVREMACAIGMAAMVHPALKIIRHDMELAA
jgi:hypothetical protein